MTLIAFHVQHDRADIVTDSWSYTYAARHLGRTPKVTRLPKLNAAVAVQGMTAFADTLNDHLAAFTTGRRRKGVDDLNRHLETTLPALWAGMGAAQADDNARTGGQVALRDSVAFVVCYSHQAGRFTATGYASRSGFEPFDPEAPFVLPSPTSTRPSDFELDQLAASLRHLGNVDTLLGLWRTRPPLPAPVTDDDWTALAELARAERAMIPAGSGVKVLIGGDVHRTTLTRSGIAHRQIHAFDDGNEVLARMMAGTLHPLGQAGACSCGSGRRGTECCLPTRAGVPCPCSSGKPFGDCCSTATPALADAIR